MESAFHYFAATRSCLGRFGKPVAFFSDKHSIFRVHAQHTTGSKALSELNAGFDKNPQAKVAQGTSSRTSSSTVR